VEHNPELDLRLDSERVRAWALEAGFTEAGLVSLPYADEARDAKRFEQWVKAGRAGTMSYLERRGAEASGRRSVAGAGTRGDSISVGALGNCVFCKL
jgi:hypothetical protein